MATNGGFSNQGRHTFNPKKHNIGVRLQQGVPILDRDWNEMEDIRRYFERMLRKYYIGNGVPKGNDGFKITAPPDKRENDFLIKAGRCMVNGYDVENEENIYYSTQVSTNAELLTTPTTNRKFLVYLDVWIESVNSDKDPDLKNSQDINMETCIRDRLFWKVRVNPWNILELPPIFLPPLVIKKIFSAIAPRTILSRYAPMIAARSAMMFLGYTPFVTSVPAELGFSWTDVDNGNIPTVAEIEKMTAPEVEAYEKDGHSIYPLAFISRQANNPKITDDMILDLRQTNLNLSHLTRRIENLESEIFLWDVTVTPEKNTTFYGSPVEIEVEVRDAHGPRKDAVVEFSSDFGSITPTIVTTDEFGRAKAILVGTVVDETLTIREIEELRGIRNCLEVAYTCANPKIENFVNAIKFSSAQMELLGRHIPGHIYRDPVMDKNILTKPPEKIPTKTATVNIRVKYSPTRLITKGLGSTQVVFRQWIKPWFTYFVNSAFDRIKTTHINEVRKLIDNNWKDDKLQPQFTANLTAHMDDIRKESNNLIANMIGREDSPSLGRIGEILYEAVSDRITPETKSVIETKITEATSANLAINEAISAINVSLNAGRIKSRLEYRIGGR